MTPLQTKSSTTLKRIPINKTLRYAMLVLILLILLLSLITTIFLYQTPTTTQEATTVAEYTQTASYAHLVSLKNNTLYDKPRLISNQAIYFKQIIKNITAILSYKYESTITGAISGNYTITAEIHTNLWTKKYTLINKTSFSKNNQTITLNQEFPINYSFYDDIVEQINTEIGMTTPNPELIVTTTINLQQTTTQGVIHTDFSPELILSLTQKTIEITENNTGLQSGILTKDTTVYHSSVIEQRNIATALTIFFVILFIAMLLITKNKLSENNETEKAIKKIYKKNGEWILKTITAPPTALQHILRLTSIDAITKIGEELNKPILHYTEEHTQRHMFYVLDSSTTYIYELQSNEKNGIRNKPKNNHLMRFKPSENDKQPSEKI